MKDKGGRTQVHAISCPNLGRSRVQSCVCPVRLAAGTVKSLIAQLRDIFRQAGRGSTWQAGNPVMKEQSISHVPVKQAVPIFKAKLERISNFIAQKLQSPLDSPIRFILARDQAFFKIQFFGGDRAGDLCLAVTQEVRRLKDDSGLVFSHTVGKTLGNGKTRVFSITRMPQSCICPVAGLELYMSEANNFSIDLSCGYIFRKVEVHKRLVLEDHVSYSSMYD